ncbi:alpha-beta hydrolase superfamily lysophospholipase [Rhodanobacter sp. K2T2]|uniref:alpha/beta fold hydrolase n=1 Tax=Rhodanobacter sp. K2T2 TaxID=2723085 RepID=UPI0015C89856|nr:alpha-beta hydrolase superfamily lysophospholipase [Rhodanobacter sp. K2T2]
MDVAATSGASSASEQDQGRIDEQRMADGLALRLRHWPLADARRAVLIVHGLGEHSGRYAHVAGWFRKRGFDVLSYDQRGHGETPGPRGALTHADDLLTDLTAVYKSYAAKHARPPLLLGHSMGGLVAARTVLDGRIQPGAMMLTSPALRSWEGAGMRKLAHVLASLLPNLPLSSGLKVDHISHDASVIAAYRNDPLVFGKITPRLADFIFRAGEASIADAAKLPVPTLLLVAGADKLVDPSGSTAFATGASSTGQLTTRHFAALYHELMNEAEPARTQVMKQMGDWLDRLPAQ